MILTVSAKTFIVTLNPLIEANAIFLEAFVLLAFTPLLSVSLTRIECIRPALHYLSDRLVSATARAIIGLRVLALLAFAVSCAHQILLETIAVQLEALTLLTLATHSLTVRQGPHIMTHEYILVLS